MSKIEIPVFQCMVLVLTVFPDLIIQNIYVSRLQGFTFPENNSVAIKRIFLRYYLQIGLALVKIRV